MRRRAMVTLLGSLVAMSGAPVPGRAAEPGPAPPAWASAAQEEMEAELVEAHGEEQRPRIRRGLAQVSSFWRASDGERDVFEGFVRRHFAGDETSLDTMFERFERLFEQLDGHMNEIVLALRWQSDLDLGPIEPYDEIFAGYSPSAHLTDDLFANKLAFVVLLNFPLTTLEQRLTEGSTWTRRQWAEARLADRFSKRVPAEAQQAVAEAGARAGQYIAQYNIWMHHLLVDGKRPFPPKLRLLSHWNLRDELKASYGDGEAGLVRQRAIRTVMEHIVAQTIPRVVIDNPHVDWNLVTNEVAPAAVRDSEDLAPEDMVVTNAREPDTRYAVILDNFRAQRQVDPWSPTAAAYEEDMPTLLEGLGFPPERARELADAIAVDPARGSGHAWGAAMRESKSRLRTRVGPEGMDYKGYNIAVHEMGHNVEQTISLREVDHTLLAGVPNTAFTEALAFVFQARDLELLGLSSPSPETRALQVLDDFWSGAEIASVALVDMGVWHWMYDNPEATPAELREATMAIARDVWRSYYAPILGDPDCLLLGVYSHMVARNLYLPDYPIGALIAIQLEEQMSKAGDLASEFTRMSAYGRVVPDLWMKNATGSPVTPEALLGATRRALEQIGE